jgi:hypothetical protein
MQPCDVQTIQRRMGSMRKHLALLALLCLLVSMMFAAAAEASCVLTTPGQQRARADVIFDGVALEGPTATGIQRFRVIRYFKGAGPRVVRVNTGTTRRADGTGTTTSVSLFVKRGEKWRIFGQGSPQKVVRTTACDGSRKR